MTVNDIQLYMAVKLWKEIALGILFPEFRLYPRLCSKLKTLLLKFLKAKNGQFPTVLLETS